MRECEYGSTTASIQMRGRTAVDSRYDMRAQTCYAVKRRAARAAVHELEFAVGGDERDGAVDIEARETHASAKEAERREAVTQGEKGGNILVELDVFHLDALALGCGAAVRLEQQLVVQAQLQLRHATQVPAAKDI